MKNEMGAKIMDGFKSNPTVAQNMTSPYVSSLHIPSDLPEHDEAGRDKFKSLKNKKNKEENTEAMGTGGSGQYSTQLFGDMTEEETNNTKDLDFYKKTKDYDKKTITAAYKIIGIKDKVIEVLNIQESENNNSMFVSGHIPYTIKIYKFRLPISQIKILDDDTKHEGFKFIEIPYWLVKKAPEQYDIKRLEGKKRLSNIYNKPVDDIRGKVDDNVIEYLEVTDGDYETLRKIKRQQDGEITKTETKEATGSGSSGSYETPAAWAKSGSRKNWRGARKTQIPGGKFVEVKKKCQKFPYCNQGDIKSLNIFENKLLMKVIKNISKKHGISENTIKNIIIKEYKKGNTLTK